MLSITLPRLVLMIRLRNKIRLETKVLFKRFKWNEVTRSRWSGGSSVPLGLLELVSDVLKHVLVTSVAHILVSFLLHLLLITYHIWCWCIESVIYTSCSNLLWSIEEWIRGHSSLPQGRETLNLILDTPLWCLPLFDFAFEQMHGHASTF